MAKLIKFDESGTIGSVSKKAFLKESPLSEEQYLQGDTHRHNFAAKIANELMDHAEAQEVVSSTGYTVNNVHLAGNATGNINISSDFKTVIEIQYHESETMAAVIA